MRIAFGSCADEEKPQPIWDAVVAYQPQVFLFARDNVYGDVRGTVAVT
jgi:alkaline phosphatase D